MDLVEAGREAFERHAWRESFDLLTEADKAQIEMQHISAQDVTKGFNEMMNQPPHVLEAMKKYLLSEQ